MNCVDGMLCRVRRWREWQRKMYKAGLSLCYCDVEGRVMALPLQNQTRVGEEPRLLPKNSRKQGLERKSYKVIKSSEVVIFIILANQFQSLRTLAQIGHTQKYISNCICLSQKFYQYDRYVPLVEKCLNVRIDVLQLRN